MGFIIQVTPLGIAFLKGHIGLSELLLNQPEIDVDFRDDNGRRLGACIAT